MLIVAVPVCNTVLDLRWYWGMLVEALIWAVSAMVIFKVLRVRDRTRPANPTNQTTGDRRPVQ
jgi:heme/copper-type cytochrome/quinol oxidase subunit 2